MKQCPNCNGQNLVSGKIGATRGTPVFSPAGQRFWSMSLLGGTQFAEDAVGCMDCGLVWSFTSAPELRDFVQKHCVPKSDGPEA